MDNELKDNNKKPPSPSEGVSPSSPGSQPIGAYGAGNGYTTDLSQEAWDKAGQKGEAWLEQDPQHRLAIRTFSRGIMGAAFFTAGGLLHNKWMAGGRDMGYVASKDFSKQLPFTAEGNPLKFMAKLIDTVVGKPIEAVAGSIGGKEFGKNFVHFRPTEYQRMDRSGNPVWGRTLGAETVGVTFDFFCASVGDAWGRDIVGWFDPNVKKDWMDEKGHINFPEAIKSSLKSITKYVTYNGGEDWAVGIPYAFYMKAQRHLIDKASPGFKYDSDRVKHGGSFKLNGNNFFLPGTRTVNPDYRPQISGNYTKEGIVDLQGRFTAYNIGTLMFREMYDHVQQLAKGRNDHLYGATDTDPKRGVMGHVVDTMKWVARSAVKGVITMTPVVPFFWITRTNQTKHNAAFIHPEHGVMTHVMQDGSSKGSRKTVWASDVFHGSMTRDEPVWFARHDPAFASRNPDGRPFERHEIPAHLSTIMLDNKPVVLNSANPGTWLDPTRLNQMNQVGPKFHPYHQGKTVFERSFDVLGETQHQIAKQLTPLSKWADQHWTFGNNLKNTMGIAKWQRFSHPFARASMSYTPYMYMKSESALRWDDGKMDLASERMIDGAAALNWGEFKAGAGEVWRSIWKEPLADPKREAEAQWRLHLDRSPPDIFDKTQVQMEDERAAFTKHWRDRVVAAKPADKKPKEAPGTDGAALEDTYKIAKRSISHSEQEAMRKALEELEPPTQSKH